MDHLTDTSSPNDIYHLCTSYRALYALRHLKSVKRLLSCISTHNNAHKFNSIDAAFDDHRFMLVTPGEQQRRRQLKRVSSQAFIDVQSERDRLRAQMELQTLQETEQLLISLPEVDRLRQQLQQHKDELSNKSMALFAHQVKHGEVRRELGHEWMEMVVLLLNRRQDKVLFISPTGAGEDFDVRSDRQVLVKVMQLHPMAHWMCALWRAGSDVVYTLDSRDSNSAAVQDSIQVKAFSKHCERIGGNTLRVESLAVAQQDDIVSCGVYVTAFCRALAMSGGVINDERLLFVDVEAERKWLEGLVRVVKEHNYVPSDAQISMMSATRKSKRARNVAANHIQSNTKVTHHDE